MVSQAEFSTHDPERALPVLGEFFPAVTMSNPHGRFAFRSISAEAESFSLVQYQLLSPGSRSSADTAGSLTIGQVDAGTLALTADRRQIDTRQPWLYPQRPVVGEWDEMTMTALSISIPAALRFARAQLGDDNFKLTFAGPAPLDPVRGRQWAALASYTRDALTGEGALVSSELVRATAFSHLASMLLTTFPNNFLEASERGRGLRPMPRAVRLAALFMEENAHLPISIEDIAQEASLSVRGLQYAFRSALDTTPTAYLRSVRLSGAHRSLQLSDPDGGVTVAAVANAWGFVHPGRFATQYRSVYGVTPRQTLES